MKKIISFLVAIVLYLFCNLNYAFANDIEKQINNNILPNSKTEELTSDNKLNKIISNSSEKDLFGDEQAFPFVAGLGKNAAH